MLIGINAKAAFHYPVTGLEEYTVRLISNLAAEAKRQRLRTLFYAPRFVHDDMPDVPLHTLRASRMWTQGRLALEFFLHPPDVFFNPEQILPFFSPAKSVVTVHDIAFEMYPQYYPRRHRWYLHRVTKRAVKRAARIIAVSERTRRDIAKCYGIPHRAIEVIHHGFSSPARIHHQSIASEIQTSAFPFPLPYVLSLGRIEYKKNLLNLISAFERVKKESGGPLSLVFAGGNGFGTPVIRQRALNSAFAKDIYFLGYIDQEMRHALYREAAVFAFPSLYEGFGLPVLEAQSFGIPVVTSNGSALPEIAGEGALFVDPEISESIAGGILEALTNSKKRQLLIKQGYQNLERFSWETCARKTLKVLTNL